jgi:hypothetical protein
MRGQGVRRTLTVPPGAGGPTVCGDGRPDEVTSVAAGPVAAVVVTGALGPALVIAPVLVIASVLVVVHRGRGGGQLPTCAD